MEDKTNSTRLEKCLKKEVTLEQDLKAEVRFHNVGKRSHRVADEGNLMRKAMEPGEKRPQARSRGVMTVENMGCRMCRGDEAVRESEETHGNTQ